MEIDIEGGGRIGTSTIQALSGLSIGEPWRASFKESAERELHGLPQVNEVDVHGQLTWPYGIRVSIEVTEREPLAVISISEEENYWGDVDGVLFTRATTHNTLLPRLTDISIEGSSGELQRVPDAVMSVVRVIMKAPGRLLARFTEIKVHPHDLELLSHEGWRARVPAADLRVQLARLDKVLMALERENISDWQMIDLRFEGELTLR